MRFFSTLIALFLMVLLTSGCQEESAPTKRILHPSVKKPPQKMEHAKEQAHKSDAHAETMEHVKEQAHKSGAHAETMEHVKEQAHKSGEHADVVTYENKKGTVTFNHKAHQEKLDDCAKCHEGEPVKIEVNKVYGHKSCKSCHKEMNGPTKCNECHVK